MKTTTPEYDASMSSPIRDRSFVEVYFQDIDPLAASDGQWQDNGHTDWSETASLDSEKQSDETIATLELNRCVFGDNFVFATDTPEPEGFVSDKMYPTGTAGSYKDAAIISRQFRRKHTFPGMSITFDTVTGEYPREISVELYDGTYMKNGGTFPIKSVESFIELPAENIDKVLISVGKSIPNRRPRIKQIIFGLERIFRNKDIVETVQRTDIDPVSRRLPKEEMSFSILDLNERYNFDSPNNLWRLVDEHAPIQIRYGYEMGNHTEWLTPDSYVLNGRPSFRNGVASFKAMSVLNGLGNRKYYKSRFGRKSLYDMAVDVLRDAKIFAPNGDPWAISESLKSITTEGILPVRSHAECLQIIAHAARCRLYTDENGIIRIEPFDLAALGSPVLPIDSNTVMEKSQKAQKIESLRSVKVDVSNYVASDTAETIYETDTTDRIVHLEFDAAQDVQFSVSGAQVVNARVYAQAADFGLSNGGVMKHVKIAGKRVGVSTTTYELSVNGAGEDDVEKNPLVTDMTEAEKLAKHMAAYLQLRKTYDMSYRGNPELQSGDVVSLQTKHTDSVPGLVLVDEIRFSGSLRGQLKIKSLNKE